MTLRRHERRPIVRLSNGLARLGAHNFAVALSEATRGYFDAQSKLVPPPLSARIMDPVRQVAAGIWPGVVIVPTMSTGATDGRFLNTSGVPTYGLSGMFHDAEGPRAHGLNERIRVGSLLNGRRFLYEVVKLYANEP